MPPQDWESCLKIFLESEMLPQGILNPLEMGILFFQYCKFELLFSWKWAASLASHAAKTWERMLQTVRGIYVSLKCQSWRTMGCPHKGQGPGYKEQGWDTGNWLPRLVHLWFFVFFFKSCSFFPIKNNISSVDNFEKSQQCLEWTSGSILFFLPAFFFPF